MPMADDEIYDVERIIGRRVSISRQLQYLVFWEGYDINECDWLAQKELADCMSAISGFEERCYQLRQARLRDPSVKPIDRYENEGIATLVDDALELYPDNASAFKDQVEDFAFHRRAGGPPGGAPVSRVATHGWNRPARDSAAASKYHITRIRGSISDTSGHIYYLTEWSDNAVTWETPRAFDNALAVLASYEHQAYRADRKKLVDLFKRSRIKADTSLISPRKAKYQLEMAPAQAAAQKAALGGLPLALTRTPTPGSAAGPAKPSGLFNLSTSLLRTDAPAASPSDADSPSSADTPLIDSLSLSDHRRTSPPSPPPEPRSELSDGSADTPLVDLLVTKEESELSTPQPIRSDRTGSPQQKTEPKRQSPPLPVPQPPQKTRTVRDRGPYVYIDHVEGSHLKRRRLAALSNDDSDFDGALSCRPRKKLTRSRPERQPSVDLPPDAVCCICNAPTDRPEERPVHCEACELVYHGMCYRRTIKRFEGEYSRPAPRSGGGGIECMFCAHFGDCTPGVLITWRVKPAALAEQPSGTKADTVADVLIKWRKRSYRHLDWVPFVWMQNKRPQMALLREVQLRINKGAVPPPVEGAFDPDFLIPAFIFSLRKHSNATRKRLHIQLTSVDVQVPRSKWCLYTDYEAVRVKWQGLDISESTWEAPPSPAEDASDYLTWYKAFEIWQRSESVSLVKRQSVPRDIRRPPQFVEYKQQPGFIRGGTLKGYQLEGASWLFKRWVERKGAVLADEMGMGKTMQVVSFMLMAYYSTVPAGLSADQILSGNMGAFPFLVVVPTTLVDNWRRELGIWAPELVVAQLSGREASREIEIQNTLFRGDSARARDLKCHVVLTSYEALYTPSSARVLSQSNIRWQAVIADEGHRLKNDETKTHQILMQFEARQRVVLTGTPVQNNLRELHCIMKFIDPSVFARAPQLDALFQSEDMGGIQKVLAGYILRRTKDEQLNLVPPKYELILPVSMTRLQRSLYKATLERNVRLLRDISAALQGSESGSRASGASTPAGEPDGLRSRRQRGALAAVPKMKTSSLNNVLMEVRRIVSHPYIIPNVEPEFPTEAEKHQRLIDSCGKLKLLHELLPELRARKHRVLIFAQFKDTLSILEDYLQGEGMQFARIDGDTPANRRQALVNEFNAPGSEMLVFLASTRTGGQGLNLTSADTVIIYDCDYNPNVDIQAMDRAHRIGQTRPVTVFKLVTRDSAEERIVEVATRKLRLGQQVFQTIDTGPKSEDAASAGEVEQALRHGASLLFAPAAEEKAEERAVVYSHASMVALLDRCERELKAELRRIEESIASKRQNAAASSKVAGFARVWDLKDGSIVQEAGGDAGSEDVDVWSRLLDRAGKGTTNGNSLLAEDVNGRMLRQRNRKVDYIEGGGASAGRVGIDAEWNDDGMEVEEEDDEFGEGVPPPFVKLPTYLVSIAELNRIVELHWEWLARAYAPATHNGQPITAESDERIKSLFDYLLQKRSSVLSAPSGDARPGLFFAIPTNMRLRMGTALPPQPTKVACPFCSLPSHGRRYCQVICDPDFIRTIREIKATEGYWHHPQYLNFARWYTVQYLWFVLEDPQGGVVSERNAQAAPSLRMDVADYMVVIRQERELRKKKYELDAVHKAEAIEFASRMDQDLYTDAAQPKSPVLYEKEAGEPLDPDRTYWMSGYGSHECRCFFDMLAQRVGGLVDPLCETDIGVLEKHLGFMYGFRNSALKCGRDNLDSLRQSKATEMVEIYNQMRGLRFVSMRVRQTRKRIRELQGRPAVSSPAVSSPAVSSPAVPVAALEAAAKEAAAKGAAARPQKASQPSSLGVPTPPPTGMPKAPGLPAPNQSLAGPPSLPTSAPVRSMSERPSGSDPREDSIMAALRVLTQLASNLQELRGAVSSMELSGTGAARLRDMEQILENTRTYCCVQLAVATKGDPGLGAGLADLLRLVLEYVKAAKASSPGTPVLSRLINSKIGALAMYLNTQQKSSEASRPVEQKLPVPLKDAPVPAKSVPVSVAASSSIAMSSAPIQVSSAPIQVSSVPIPVPPASIQVSSAACTMATLGPSMTAQVRTVSPPSCTAGPHVSAGLSSITIPTQSVRPSAPFIPPPMPLATASLHMASAAQPMRSHLPVATTASFISPTFVGAMPPSMVSMVTPGATPATACSQAAVTVPPVGYAWSRAPSLQTYRPVGSAVPNGYAAYPMTAGAFPATGTQSVYPAATGPQSVYPPATYGGAGPVSANGGYRQPVPPGYGAGRSNSAASGVGQGGLAGTAGTRSDTMLLRGMQRLPAAGLAQLTAPQLEKILAVIEQHPYRAEFYNLEQQLRGLVRQANQQQQVVWPASGMETSLMTPQSAPWGATYDLACALCNDPHHQPSQCPDRMNEDKLLRRLVALRDNTELPPNIKELTITTVRRFLMQMFKD
ncbi:hypothetical protein GGF46_000355 [Coemansia sp. RSA 552]|nr:hypothetical protein GGF46_000355 [Coemansia sp. RSA 552]